jgi:hypothetical protein
MRTNFLWLVASPALPLLIPRCTWYALEFLPCRHRQYFHFITWECLGSCLTQGTRSAVYRLWWIGQRGYNAGGKPNSETTRTRVQGPCDYGCPVRVKSGCRDPVRQSQPAFLLIYSNLLESSEPQRWVPSWRQSLSRTVFITIAHNA